MRVMKFGGTSVGKPERMRQVAKLATNGSEPTLVVLSALSGTTNTLVAIGESLSKGNIDAANGHIEKLELHYFQFIASLFEGKDEFEKKAKEIVDEHFGFLKITTRISFNESLGKEILAQGELLSTKIFSVFLDSISISHALIPALDFMVLDANEEPNLEGIEQKLLPLLEKQAPTTLFVTQGYICRNAKGEIDNLKRGGSDYTASLVAAALRATVCEIWTDIDGMHNNDPRIVEKTRPIELLGFDEAAELAYFGAKILHPTCIWPAQQHNVPVKLLNTMQPDAKGTTISSVISGDGVKAIAAKDGIIAIRIKSSRMLLAYGFLKLVFEVFETYKTPIDMITTSEVAVSLTIDSDENLDGILAELEKFGKVEVDRDQTIVAIVGNNISHDDSILKKLFACLESLPVRMVSFGGSQHNISLLVPAAHKKQALSLINKGLFGL